MSWNPQDENTFRDRIVRIERKERGGLFRRRRQRRDRTHKSAGIITRLPLNTVLVIGCLLIAMKCMVLAGTSEGAYRSAAVELRQEGTMGIVLSIIFGPDPISTELSRHLRF